MDSDILQNQIEMLINSKREDDYWDFKQIHHKNTADLLHDIICMANNRADRDAYIIYGVSDKSFEIIGVENDSNRRNQQQIIDQLKNKKFSSGIRPRIELRTLKIENHEIDVLVIKNTTDTPYYLTEDYREQDRVVKGQYIYTRVCDTNTDINRGADINHIEYLWKKRFLLNRPPLEQIMGKLIRKKEWKKEGDTYFNIYNPEYTIEIIDDEDKDFPEFYSYAMCNSGTSYSSIEVKCYGTKLYSHQIVTLDSGRYTTTTPILEYISFNEYKSKYDYLYKYFIKQDIEYKLHLFLLDEESHEAVIAYERFMEVILIFESLMEKEKFIYYVYSHQSQLVDYICSIQEYRCIEVENELYQEEIIKRLRTGTALNMMLRDFRNESV